MHPLLENLVTSATELLKDPAAGVVIVCLAFLSAVAMLYLLAGILSRIVTSFPFAFMVTTLVVMWGGVTMVRIIESWWLAFFVLVAGSVTAISAAEYYTKYHKDE